jgi:hypothetical protein
MGRRKTFPITGYLLCTTEKPNKLHTKPSLTIFFHVHIGHPLHSSVKLPTSLCLLDVKCKTFKFALTHTYIHTPRITTNWTLIWRFFFCCHRVLSSLLDPCCTYRHNHHNQHHHNYYYSYILLFTVHRKLLFGLEKKISVLTKLMCLVLFLLL